MINGGPETDNPTDLLKTGFLLWFYTIIAFAFLYWVLDGGGPESRFIDTTAFSPTDVMPLTRWAKLAMTVQAVSSLMILGLVIARAVNVLK